MVGVELRSTETRRKAAREGGLPDAEGPIGQGATMGFWPCDPSTELRIDRL